MDFEAVAANADFEGVVIDFAFALGSKRKRVLVAGLFGDAGIELLEGVAFGAEVNIAAGILGIADQAGEFAIEVAAAGGDGVDGDVGAKQSSESFVVFVGVELGAVLAIADEQDYFAAITGAVFEEFGGGIDGVVEGLSGLPFDRLEARGIHRSTRSGLVVDRRAIEGTAGRRSGGGRGDFGTAKFGDKFVLIPGETLTFVEGLVEAADEGFVIGAEAADDGTKTGLDLAGVFGLEVIVNENDQRERESLDGEVENLLFDIVLKHAEFVFAKIGYQSTLAVLDGYGQNDKGGIQDDSGGHIGGEGLRRTAGLRRWQLRLRWLGEGRLGLWLRLWSGRVRDGLLGERGSGEQS